MSDGRPRCERSGASNTCRPLRLPSNRSWHLEPSFAKLAHGRVDQSRSARQSHRQRGSRALMKQRCTSRMYPHLNNNSVDRCVDRWEVATRVAYCTLYSSENGAHPRGFGSAQSRGIHSGTRVPSGSCRQQHSCSGVKMHDEHPQRSDSQHSRMRRTATLETT